MEKRQPAILRIGKVLLDVVELYIPMAVFVMMFVLFIVNIFFRYVLNSPLTWPFELIVSGFVWLAILSATYVRRVGGHVKFTMTYERMSPLMQTVVRIIVNLIIGGLFITITPATLDWVDFMAFKPTASLRIPFSYVYLPTVPFLILVAAHCIYDVVMDIRHLVKHDFTKDEEEPEVRA
jgi:C4-dicarboxylate transporter DctQ subunit